jgi:hypothetical protein
MNIGVDYYNLLYVYLLQQNSPNTGPLLNEDDICNVRIVCCSIDPRVSVFNYFILFVSIYYCSINIIALNKPK